MGNPYYSVYLLILCTCCVIGSVRLKAFDPFYKMIFLQVATAMIAELAAKTVLAKQPNHMLYNFYILIEMWIYSFALRKKLHHVKKNILWSSFFSTFVWLLQVYFNGLDRFANYAYLCGGLLQSSVCIIGVMVSIRKGYNVFDSTPLVLIYLGLCVYYFCDVPVLAVATSGYIVQAGYFDLFSINCVLAALKYALFAVSFIKYRKSFRHTERALVVS